MTDARNYRAVLALILVLAIPWESGFAVAATQEMSLDGQTEGTDLGNLIIEGEDQIHIDYARPRLDLDKDLRPRQAPGLDWENTWETVDLYSRLSQSTAFATCSTLGRPWLRQFAAGDVARFQPQVSTEGRWSLTVVDSRGLALRRFTGRGKAPEEILWDGRDDEGEPVTPGLTYSFSMEAQDRAGNSRSYIGEGFELPPFLLMDQDSLKLVFAGEHILSAGDSASSALRPELLLREAASWLNQMENVEARIEVRTLARSASQAKDLSRQVAATLAPMLAGDPKRIACLSARREDAPDHGTVLIQLSR